MARKTANTRKNDDSSDAIARGRFWRYCTALLLSGAVILTWMSVLTFSPLDPPSTQVYPAQSPVANAAGTAGAWVAYMLRYWVGWGTYLALVFATIAAGVLIAGRKITDLQWRLIGLTLLVCSGSAMMYVISPTSGEDIAAGWSGVLGLTIGEVMLDRFANAGSWILLLITMTIGLLLTADNLVLILLGRVVALWRNRGQIAQAVKAFRMTGAFSASAKTAMPARGPVPISSGRPARIPAPTGASGDNNAESKSVGAMARKVVSRLLPSSKDTLASGSASKPDVAKVAQPKPAAAPKPAASKPAEGQVGFVLPSTDLLSEPKGGYVESQQDYVNEQRDVLQRTLNEFRVQAEVVGFMTGPVITMFEVSLAAGVKVSQVANLANDLARSLAVPGVRIVSPLPGRDTIGIEVPNLEKETVLIKELMNLAPEADKNMQLALYLGKDAEGLPIVSDLAAMPHMLIAGTTGSGKSVCINTIIMSLLMTRTPEEVRFVLIDPKMVEMAAFEKIRHLLCPIVNDMRKAEGILEWAAIKMDERYELLKEAGVRNIKGYNELSEKELYERFGAEDDAEKARIPTKLAYYVIIVDELADLMMTSGKEVENYIIRIAQKARAVGIHLVLATQRPSVNVVTGLIKSNMPCRASFRVASRQESRIVLDQNGAEVLLGQGDMLFLEPGTSNLKRAQGTFVSDKEIRTVVKEIHRGGEPSFDTELSDMNGPDGVNVSSERDELFDKAVEIVLASKRGSVSLLQRRLAIGYSRSSRIIDQMAEAGLLGDYKGSQAREVLMTLDDWHSFKGAIAADQSGASSINGEPTSV